VTVADIPVFRDGVMATAADLNALVDNVNNLYTVGMGGAGFTAKKPHLVLRVTSAVRSITRLVDTAVVWDIADVNTDSMWSSGSTITVQHSGTYRLDAQVGVNGSFNDGINVYITVNGTTASSNGVGVWRDGKGYRGRCSATVSLVASSTITVVVNHTAGVNRNLSASGGGCRFAASWIGPA
jgi:hypothetical protein